MKTEIKSLPDGQWAVLADGVEIGQLHSRLAAECVATAIENGPIPFGTVARWDTDQFVRQEMRA